MVEENGAVRLGRRARLVTSTHAAPLRLPRTTARQTTPFGTVR